jgi:D-xylose transport system substrate-binding protein
MGSVRGSLGAIGALVAFSLVLTACSNSSDTTSPPPPSASSGGEVPQISAADFTADFAVMQQLTGLAAQGDGLIGVLLPDTTTSTRYVQYDAPFLKKAFEAAGLTSDQYKIDNAHGSAQTMQTQADADINAGASVLLIDPLDAGSGAAIEAKAESQGVAVIDYDRLVSGGPADRYYVSFNNVQVGQLIGQGEVDCIDAWKVQDPSLLIMDGDPTDNNAKLFAEGYNSVLDPLFSDNTYTKVGEPAGTWDPPTAATTFEQQFTAHPEINAVVTPNDDNANAVISILKKNEIPANTFPTTGQDASPVGLQNILTGYQCGTVYKPFHAEAQAAAALALYLRAGVTPPDTLVNATTKDDEIGKDIPSVYTVPVWVTTDTVADVLADSETTGVGPTVADVCTGEVQSACADAGIS